LHACLPDDLGSFVNLAMHISNLRKKLLPLGGYVASYRSTINGKPASMYVCGPIQNGRSVGP